MAGRVRNKNATCGNCLYGEENDHDPLTIDCHRFPPVYISSSIKEDDEEYDTFRFPAHTYSSFCGEHPDFWESK